MLAGMPSALGLTMAEFAVGEDAVCTSFERGGLAKVPGLAGMPSEWLVRMPNGGPVYCGWLPMLKCKIIKERPMKSKERM